MNDENFTPTIEERLLRAEAAIELLNNELFGVMMVVARLMHAHPDMDELYRWACRLANDLEADGKRLDEVVALDAIRDLFDGLRDELSPRQESPS